MSYSKANMKAVDRYVKANYDRIEVKVPKGLKQTIEAHAKEKGESVNGLVNRLLRAELSLSERDWKAACTKSTQSRLDKMST